MVAVTPESAPETSAAEDKVSVASNWTLVWWRFRKHKLAMLSAFLLIVLYAVVLAPDFFSTQVQTLHRDEGLAHRAGPVQFLTPSGHLQTKVWSYRKGKGRGGAPLPYLRPGQDRRRPAVG